MKSYLLLYTPMLLVDYPYRVTVKAKKSKRNHQLFMSGAELELIMIRAKKNSFSFRFPTSIRSAGSAQSSRRPQGASQRSFMVEGIASMVFGVQGFKVHN